MNATLDHGWFNVRRDCVRIEKLLYKNALVVKQCFRKATGRKKQLEEDIYKLSIRRNDIETVEALKCELEKCQIELEEWKGSTRI